MQFAVPFVRDFKYINQNVQFNINYKPKIKELDEFIEKYKTHRINMIFDIEFQEDDIKIIKALLEKYPECELISCFPFYQPNIEELLVENNIPHYYSEFITTWDKFQGFLSLEVTDIFIAEELAFSAKILSKNAKKNGKSLRAFCNVCQSSWDRTESIKTFFVRPEDIYLYDGIIDTFEFYVDSRNVTKINTLYEIYAKDQFWHGNLSQIIVGYIGDENSQYMLPRFGEHRLNCGKSCAQGIKPSCHICDKIIELEEFLKSEKIAVQIDK